jgi:hypothetical protein
MKPGPVKISKLLLTALLIVLAASAFAQKRVVGALPTYRYWAGEDPDGSKKVLNGEYTSYAGLGKEYELYMEIIIKPKLAAYFITDNKLSRGSYQLPVGAPKWFKPPKTFSVWTDNQGSIYFINVKTGHIFMYEIHL